MTEEAKPRTSCGVNGTSAWVCHRAADGTETLYTVDPRESLHVFTADDLKITKVEGPDVLPTREVLNAAHDAYCDACGVL